MLLPIHEAELTIPEFWAEKGARIAGNLVRQLGCEQAQGFCQLYEYAKKALFVKMPSHPNFREFYIRLPLCKASFPENAIILKPADNSINISDYGPETGFKWVDPPAVYQLLLPNQIVNSWCDKFYFSEENLDINKPGLRRPQLGAIHAIAAHLSVKDDQPATIVMPTGIGKTETMLSSLVYNQCERVLVLVPSSILRTQIFNKFVTLGCLPEIGVVSKEIIRPRVSMLKQGIKNVAECKKLIGTSNVLISTPNLLNNLSEDVLEVLTESCSHLFIDEAHHVAAGTWSKIRDSFKNRKILQFTATPFRNDGKSLNGKVIYNYKLGEAQEAGYFKHIRLSPIEEYHGDYEADEKVASAALSILDDDIKQGYDHILMARVSTIKRAEELLPIYQRLAPDRNPCVIHSSMNKTETDGFFGSLNSRDTTAIICVDMLGEGFDLPNLKVAAIHDMHKSLAITLQFIGRFTRTAQAVGDAAAVVNVADPKVQDSLQSLYAENADWDKILRRQSEDVIGKEVALLDLVESLKGHGELSKHLSLWNLRPSFSTLIYSTQCDSWSPLAFVNVLSKKCTYWHALSHSLNILVVVVSRSEEVKWGRYKDLNDNTLELMIACWDYERKALFLYCSDYDFFRCDTMAKAICGETIEPVTGEKLFRIFGGVERPMVRNLGASKAGTISFTMYFGPNVTNGLDEVEKRQSNLNNLTGWGYELGEKVTWGCSQKKGKIWSVCGGPITEGEEWSACAWDKVMDSSIKESEITAGFLRPEVLKERYPSVPFSIQWGEKIISRPEDNVSIALGEVVQRIHEIDIEVALYSEKGPIQFNIKNDEICSTYELRIDSDNENGYEYKHVQGPKVTVQIGNGQPRSFEEYMVFDPVIIAYIDGSFSYNKFIVKVKESVDFFDKDNIEVCDWSGVDLKKESQGKEVLQDSIQYKIAQDIKQDYAVVFDDDNCGEAADLIGIRETEDHQIELDLIHCKFSSEEAPGARIGDMYTVCGQAQKCIRWKHSGFNYLADHMKRRQAKWESDGSTRFITGDLKELSYLKKQARRSRIKLNVVVVQPGLSKSKVSDDILKLLASTELFLKKTSDANFSVICSE